MTIEVGGAGTAGARMIMPMDTATASVIYTKTTATTVNNSLESAFYSAWEADFASNGNIMRAATLQPAPNTDEQDIVNTGTGVSGVLTAVLSPKLSAVGDMTIRVYADGEVISFTANLTDANDDAVILGDFKPWGGSNSSYQIGGNGDAGLAVSPTVSMLSPRSSALSGLPVGIVFNDSLRVTVQGSVNITAGSSTHKAVAAWIPYIPRGV